MLQMKTDIQIAQEATMLPIKEVAASYGIVEDDLELYGKYKAKLTDELWSQVKDRPDGKLVLVTAINPTPAGEGKTTTSVGLGDALTRLGKKTLIALREPSLGPCFGIKGGAAGGGYAQVVPMEDLNLHFTGDFHAITSANNLLAALMDNHIQQGNALGIDTRQILWKRCLDMNDRVLRNIVVGLGSKMDGVVREDHFVITVASEIMAILCLANDMKDLKEGMILKGTVRNVIDFGAFVDIGVHQDGLVHISQICDRFIKHPLEAVSVGDIVEVKVLDVDLEKKRIALTMKGI